MNNAGRLFIAFALIMFILSLIFGTLAAHSYTSPGWWKDTLGFISLRPLHVSSALFWILIGATGAIFLACSTIPALHWPEKTAYLQLGLWFVAVSGIFFSYFTGTFGGREYWEFPPIYAFPIAISWLIFVWNFIPSALKIKDWPVYLWMWMTGMVFFLFTFAESYAWQFSWFREHFIRDMTVQWKSGGAMVGAWNQLIYGLSFYLMERLSHDKQFTRSPTAFGMYFLGLFNLMFNWSHHIYTLPTEQYIRYVGYGVSMTEWVLFLRIIISWRKTLIDAQKLSHYFTYSFLLAAEGWVFLNLGLALLLSIPAINIYTHGTHVTVAHAMGTTMGINSMILLAACFEFVRERISIGEKKIMRIAFAVNQISLVVFWLDLIVAGIKKGMWQMNPGTTSFQQMMMGLHTYFRILNWAGGFLMVSLGYIAWILLKHHFIAWLQDDQQHDHAN